MRQSSEGSTELKASFSASRRTAYFMRSMTVPARTSETPVPEVA